MKNRGFSSAYLPPYRDKKTREIKKQAVWWIQYCRNGKPIRESSGSTREADAWKLLKRRHGEIAAGRPVGADVNRTTFDDMATMVINDYKANDYSSLTAKRMPSTTCATSSGSTGPLKSPPIGSRPMLPFARTRSRQFAPSTVSWRSFAYVHLSHAGGQGASKPYIGKLETNNARKGFFERDQLEAV